MFFLLIIPILVSAQEEASPCAENVNKKAVSLYEKGIDKKKYDFRERVDFLRKAVELEPEYVNALYELATLVIKEARADGKSFKPAEKYLLKVVEVCPDHNPYAYFYLGQIAYGSSKYPEAVTYLEKFLKVPENAKKDEDYTLATQLVKEAKFYDQMFNHPVPFDPKPVKDICTYEDEYLAMLSPDNEDLYFTKKYMKHAKNDMYAKLVEEFTHSRRIGDVFEKGNAMEPPFNIGDNYGGATFSIDNKQMYITVCKPEKRKGGGPVMNCDLYLSSYVKGQWTELKNLGPGVNTPDGWEAQPTLSSDGKQLFFASARADSKGMDIYVSERLPSGEWGPAKNVGAPINTDGNEKSPFIHSDSQTLYFSSDGQQGLGGYDVFLTRMDEKTNSWTKPKNIGHPINTENDEVGFFVSSDGKLGYFSSNTLKGKGAGGYDVFHFDLYKEARPERVMFIKGDLKDEFGKDLDHAKVKIKSVDSKKETEAIVDSVTGEFAAVVTVKNDEKFLISVKHPDVVFNSGIIQATDSTTRPIKMSFEMKYVTPGAAYQLNNIYYNTNSAELMPESKDVVNEFAEYLKEHPTIKIEVQGHTDNVGNAASNLALSTDRAFTVYALLQDKGIDKSRLSFKGYGPNKPVASNDSPEGRARNRRTEFVILSK